MISRTLDYLRRHALATAAFICSILALASSSYAAFTISGSDITNHTINPGKFNPKFINGSVRAWAIVAPNGRVIRGAGGPKVTLQAGDPGGYGIRWRVGVGRCETSATIDYSSSSGGGAAFASTNRRTRQSSGTFVQTVNKLGQPAPFGFDVAVIC